MPNVTIVLKSLLDLFKSEYLKSIKDDVLTSQDNYKLVEIVRYINQTFNEFMVFKTNTKIVDNINLVGLIYNVNIIFLITEEGESHLDGFLEDLIDHIKFNDDEGIHPNPLSDKISINKHGVYVDESIMNLINDDNDEPLVLPSLDIYDINASDLNTLYSTIDQKLMLTQAYRNIE